MKAAGKTVVKKKPDNWVTYERLKTLRACYGQRVKFRKEWPDGCRLTRKNLVRAAHLGLSLDWLGYMLYRQSTAPFMKEFNKKRFASAVQKENEIDRVIPHPLAKLTQAEHRAQNREIAQAHLRHRVRVAHLLYEMVSTHGLPPGVWKWRCA